MSRKKKGWRRHRFLRNTVAQNICAERSARGWTRKALADKAGVVVSYISMVERGLRSPSLETIEAIAKALRVKPIDLFDFDEPEVGEP